MPKKQKNASNSHKSKNDHEDEFATDDIHFFNHRTSKGTQHTLRSNRSLCKVKNSQQNSPDKNQCKK